MINDLTTTVKSTHAIKLENVQTSFDLVPLEFSDGFAFNGSGRISSNEMDHIQGFSFTDRYSFLTVNQDGEKRGTIFIYDSQSGDYFETYQVPVDNMNHPSGVQNIGDFLVFGLQTQDYKTSKVCFLNMEGLMNNDGHPIELLPLSVPLEGQTTASVGITDIEDANGVIRYVLAVSGNGSTSVFLSSPTEIGLADSSLEFSKIKTFPGLSYQGIQLLTQADGKVFMIAFDSEEVEIKGIPITFKDYILLYELSGAFDNSLRMTCLKKNHVTTGGGDLPLALKPHCRYGSGISLEDGIINCFVTGRQAQPFHGIGEAPYINIFRGGKAPSNPKLKFIDAVDASYHPLEGQEHRCSENFPDLNMPEEGTLIMFKVESKVEGVVFSIWEDLNFWKDDIWWTDQRNDSTIKYDHSSGGHGLYVVTTECPNGASGTYRVSMYEVLPN